MNANHLESKFAMMGARLKVSVLPEQRASEHYAVDIQKDGVLGLPGFMPLKNGKAGSKQLLEDGAS